eukprot:jgi/Chrzof1/9289/UNPLg00256.t1
MPTACKLVFIVACFLVCSAVQASAPAVATELGGVDGLTAEEQSLLDWVVQGGAKLHVTIGRNRNGLRGLIATSNISEGDVILSVPASRCLQLPVGGQTVESIVAEFARLRLNPNREYTPYFKTLPSSADVALSYDTYPFEYLPLLESDVMVKYIREGQLALASYWVANALQLTKNGVTLQALKQSMALVTTRWFSFKAADGDQPDFYMVPVLDMANHYNDCANRYRRMPCPDDVFSTCIVFLAGDHISAGEEVCNFYGYLTPDKALLNYGYLLPNTPGVLHTIDQHDHTFEQLYKPKHSAQPPLFSGSTMQISAELLRLQQLLTTLESHNEVVASKWPVSSDDPHGNMLQLIKQWRLIRQEAIQGEIDRLSGLLSNSTQSSNVTQAAQHGDLLHSVSSQGVAAVATHHSEL